MIEPQPVPEGLLQRALDTAFTTESWPEWDELDLVPDFDGGPDLDELDFTPLTDGEDSVATGEDASAVPTADADTHADADADADPGNGYDTLPDPLADTVFEDSATGYDDQFGEPDLGLDDFDF